MRTLVGGIVLMATTLAGGNTAGAAEPWKPPAVRLAEKVTRPAVACTAEELARVRAAWRGQGPDHNAVAALVRKAERELRQAIDIPPEGGQHNQWYQCDRCQISLKTVDGGHHKCPKCGKVYTGFPYDNVLYTRAHHNNAGRMARAAWAWAITGRKAFADRAADWLRRYADIYLEYPYISASVGKPGPIKQGTSWAFRSAGRILNQTLNEAMWLVDASAAYDLIHETLSPADRKRIEAGLLRAMCENIAKNRMGKSNWQTWHNAATLWAGAALGEEKLVRRALLDPANGFVFQMTAGVSAEGMWYENSWGYHYYTLRAMTHIAEGARRLGVDLYSHPALRKMYLLGADYVMSDGSLPRFGDDVQSTPAAADLNEAAYAAYRDDRLLALLGGRRSFQSVLLGRSIDPKSAPGGDGKAVSRLFPRAGHAILRASGPARLTAAVTFGPYGGFHGHFDKLSFVLFGHGRELGVDPGRAGSQAYRLPIHTDWYKATVSHNAVLVDGRGQRAAAGRCLFFRAAPTFVAVAVACDEGLAAVRHRRLLLLTPRCLLVYDELEPTDGREHTYWWVYHNVGRRVVCQGTPSKGKLPARRGFEYFQDPAGFAPEGDILVRFDMAPSKVPGSTGPLAVHLRMLGRGDRGGDEVFTATGPFRSVDDRVPAVLVRRRGGAVRFLAALEPVVADAEPGVRRLAIDQRDGRLTVSLGLEGRAVTVRLPDGRISKTCTVETAPSRGISR